MPFSVDDKRQAIADRRQGPETNLFGAKLDLKMAEAADDEYAINAARARVESFQAQLDALDEALKEVNTEAAEDE